NSAVMQTRPVCRLSHHCRRPLDTRPTTPTESNAAVTHSISSRYVTSQIHYRRSRLSWQRQCQQKESVRQTLAATCDELCASGSEGLDQLGDPRQLRVGQPEIGEMPQGAGEIIPVGATTTDGTRNDLRCLLQRQRTHVVRMIAPYNEGERRQGASAGSHRQSPHIVSPGGCHFA